MADGRIMVTGGAGYVGSHCVRALCDAGFDVVVLDNFCSGHRQAVDERASLIEGDLSNHHLIRQTLAGGEVDGVMHFAAHLDVNESVRDPLKYYENNIVNTIRLLGAMADAGVRKFVFSSTCATYGEPDVCPITEDTNQAPINPYGHTKLAMEWAMRDSADAWDLGGCALRYFNASGAASDGSIGEDHDPEFHLIPVVLQVALGQREKVFIFGTDYPTPDGTCVRDYIHVEDLASAHVLAMQTQKPGEFRCYNVGTGNGASVREIIDACRDVTGHAIPAIESPRREGDPPQLFADPSKIRRELGWSCKHANIRSVVETAWKWHQSHPNGYED
jgi:UDP-glucose 4-epimerase